MQTARTLTVGVIGIEGHIIEVEASAANGAPGLYLTGLLDRPAQETRDRVRAAIINAGFPWPAKRLAVNLVPAALPKHGTAIDLSIAVAVLSATGAAPSIPEATVFLGELGLDGRLRAVTGILPAALAAAEAGFTTVVVPVGNAAEATPVAGLTVIAADDLAAVVSWLASGDTLTVSPDPTAALPSPDPEPFAQLRDVPVPAELIPVLEIAAAGRHHLFLSGRQWPFRYARMMIPFLPDLTEAEALEVRAAYSAAGTLTAHRLQTLRPPYRCPHPASGTAQLLGPGVPPRPGEIALAHRGVFHVDEAAFSSELFRTLPTVLKTGEVAVDRKGVLTRFPAQIQLVLNGTLCPCGAQDEKTCACSPKGSARHAARVPAEVLSHVDLKFAIPPVPAAKMTSRYHEDLEAVAGRVRAARQRAARRLAGTPWTVNAHVPLLELRRRYVPARTALDPLYAAIDAGALARRQADRILRIAWTITDLADRDEPTAHDIAAALALYNGTAPSE